MAYLYVGPLLYPLMPTVVCLHDIGSTHLISLDNRQKLQNVCSNAEQAPKYADGYFGLVPMICGLI